MKCTVITGESEREEVVIYCRRRTPLVERIERLADSDDDRLLGFKNGEVTVLNTGDVYCFVVENNKVQAVLENEKFTLKQRLYTIEECLGPEFIKINQSCVANLEKILKFDTTVAGSLKVIFKNGYVDYVSRRNIKSIKERLGL